MLDLDDGLETGMTLKDDYSASRMNVDVIACLEDDPDKGVAWLKAQKTVRVILKMCSEERYPFQGLCIDSFSALASACMRWVQGNSGRIGENPTQPEWGLMIVAIKSIMVLLRALPIPVILTAHEYRLEQDDGMGSITEIAIPGRKLPTDVTGAFDEVWRYRIEGGGVNRKFRIQTQATSSILARSRFNLKDGLDVSKVSMVRLLRECGCEWKVGDEDTDLEELRERRRKEKESKEQNKDKKK